MALVLLVVVLAVLGGFLGDLLEFAAWVVGILALAGAIIGFVLYRAFVQLKKRVT